MNDARKQAIVARGWECAVGAFASAGLHLEPPRVGNNAKINSPFRPDSNPSVDVFYEAAGGKSPGMWIDRTTGEGGDIFKLVARLCNLDVKTQFTQVMEACERFLNMPVAPPAEARQNGHAPAKKVWLPEPTHDALAESYGLSWADFKEAGFSLGAARGHKHVVYPVTHPDGTMSEKCKSLAREGTPEKSKRSQWVSASGKETGIIGADCLGALFGSPLVIAGGEEKMLAARKADYHAICPQNGEKALSAGALKMVVDAQPTAVIIAYDADTAGDLGRDALAEQLLGAGIADVRAVRWPEGVPEAWDLNDVLKTEGVEGVKRYLDNAQPMSTKNLVTSHFTESDQNDATAEESEEDAELDRIFELGGTLPSFPIHALSLFQRNMVTEVCEESQLPAEVVAPMLLGMVSAALANKALIRIRAGSFEESTNLYIVAPMASGERKTSVFNALSKPLREWEREKVTDFANQSETIADEVELLNARLSTLKNKIKKEGDISPAHPEWVEKKARLKKLTQDRKQPNFLLNDATVEGITAILEETGGHCAIIDDEGGIFQVSAGGLYNQGRSNINTLLKGDNAGTIKNYRSSREGKKWQIIYDATITFMISPQVGVLKELAKNPMMREKGFLARFFYSFGQSKMGFRNTWPRFMDTQIVAWYDRQLRLLCDLGRQKNGDQERPHILKLSADGEKVFREFLEWNEIQLRPGNDIAALLRDWAAKMPRLCAKIASILHICDNMGENHPWLDKTIDGPTVARAIEITRYALEHAKRAYTIMGQNSTPARAKAIVIRWASKRPSFTSHELTQAVKDRLKSADERENALADLVSEGLLKRALEDRNGQRTLVYTFVVRS